MPEETPGVDIQVTPAGPPQIPPPVLPTDSKLKELLAELSKRLDTLNATVLDGNTKADAQKSDIKKLADLIMEDTTIGFDAFKKKVVDQNIPAQIQSRGAGLRDLINIFVPDICGDVAELLNLKKKADDNGEKKTG